MPGLEGTCASRRGPPRPLGVTRMSQRLAFRISDSVYTSVAVSSIATLWLPRVRFGAYIAAVTAPRPITPAHARRVALRATGLDGAWRPGRGAAGAAATIERLGYVQIDTIAVVERAHEHTLWVRQPSYQPRYLHRLLAEERRVFEYWTHAASYVPMADYRFYRRRMEARARGGRRVGWMRDNRAVVDAVRERITAEGPLAAAAFDNPGKRGPWWDWKPAKMALESMFDTGELMIGERRGFQRVYDLAERVLPAQVDLVAPAADEQARWALRRTLDNAGLADTAERHRWHGDVDELNAAAAELVDTGELTPVRIRGDEAAGTRFARTEVLEATAHGRPTRRVYLLSPFDNLVIRRRWLQQVFGFDYTLECYVPEPKRRYGYFCLPVLFGDRFVGRLDPKAERREGVFVVRRLCFEPEVDDWDALLPALATALAAMARFNGCASVRVESIQPGRAKAPLRRALKDEI